MPRDYEIPAKYLCTITAKIMFEPMMAADGHTYEREAIEEWLKTHDTSPKTHAKLRHKELVDNHEKQNDIATFLDIHPELYETEVYLPKTPFHLAATRNDVTLLSRLLKTKAASCVNAEDANGNTALHLAARVEHEEAIYLLLKAGAYHKLKNKQGQTPIKLAMAQQKRQIANFIIQTAKSLKQSELKEQADKTAQLEAALLQESKQVLELKNALESQERSFKTQLLSIEQALNEARNKYVTADRLQSMEEQIKQLGFVAPESAKSSSASSTSVIKTSFPVDEKDVGEFLRWVAEGEQDKAEEMLKSNSALALVRGDVTDLSKRTFNNITGFQYAVWALDWHMWTMIRKYLPDNEAKQQAEEFERGAWVKQHGIHAQYLLDDLIQALRAIIVSNRDADWVQQVGNAQRFLPAHVVNEYCHKRPFIPVPNFEDAIALPRSRAIEGGEWFTVSYNGGALGDKFAVYKGNALEAMASASFVGWGIGNACGDKKFRWHMAVSWCIQKDLESISTLAGTRISQRERLIAELNLKFVQIYAVPTVVSNVNTKDISEFLTLVAQGEQDKAEGMLKNNFALALIAGDVTDLSKRTFTNITGFQYAAWALDWHMWTMIRKYLPDETAREQAKGFKTGSWVSEYGIHINLMNENKPGVLDNIIKGYQTTFDLYRQEKYAEGDDIFSQQVGKAQTLFPVHIVNEFCHPGHSFYPTIPDFNSVLFLHRTRFTRNGEWFSLKWNNGVKAIVRGWDSVASCYNGGAKYNRIERGYCPMVNDYESLASLVVCRTAQREQLEVELSIKNLPEVSRTS